MTNEPERRGPGRPPKRTDAPGDMRVKILRGYWPMGTRTKAKPGEFCRLPIDEAKRVISLGIAERADPFPSE